MRCPIYSVAQLYDMQFVDLLKDSCEATLATRDLLKMLKSALKREEKELEVAPHRHAFTHI